MRCWFLTKWASIVFFGVGLSKYPFMNLGLFKLRLALKCIYLPSKIWISIWGQNKDIEMKGQFCFEKHLKCPETQEHCSNTQNKTIKTENSQVRRICIPIRNARTKVANYCSYLWFQIIRYFFATNTFSEKRLYSIIFESQKQKQ